MSLTTVGQVEPEWSQELRLDMDVLRAKLSHLASLLCPEPEPPAGGCPRS